MLPNAGNPNLFLSIIALVEYSIVLVYSSKLCTIVRLGSRRRGKVEFKFGKKWGWHFWWTSLRVTYSTVPLTSNLDATGRKATELHLHAGNIFSLFGSVMVFGCCSADDMTINGFPSLHLYDYIVIVILRSYLIPASFINLVHTSSAPALSSVTKSSFYLNIAAILSSFLTMASCQVDPQERARLREPYKQAVRSLIHEL